MTMIPFARLAPDAPRFPSPAPRLRGARRAMALRPRRTERLRGARRCARLHRRDGGGRPLRPIDAPANLRRGALPAEDHRGDAAAAARAAEVVRLRAAAAL